MSSFLSDFAARVAASQREERRDRLRLIRFFAGVVLLCNVLPVAVALVFG